MCDEKDYYEYVDYNGHTMVICREHDTMFLREDGCPNKDEEE